MGRVNIEDLSDLGPLLEAVRELPGIVEKSPGVFYYRGGAFLHFHVKGDTRWADLKSKSGWEPEIFLPEGDSGAIADAIERAKACHASHCKA